MTGVNGILTILQLICVHRRTRMIKRTAMLLAVVIFIGTVLFACLAGGRFFAYMAELQAEHLRSSMHQQP
jgi:hypothetical protein